ncbi:hypothetical protein DB42_AK01010 [Neochlamydia sp. EPS4]|nr:hypothetical protein DB42_AK01010 [Neochlamydia sp. EPS4]
MIFLQKSKGLGSNYIVLSCSLYDCLLYEKISFSRREIPFRGLGKQINIFKSVLAEV